MQAASLILLSQQNALQQAMDVVSNNVANSSTSGFKRSGISFDSFLSRPEQGQTVNFVVDRGTYRDTSSGPIEKTGNSLDLAIEGNGYFQVKAADGSTRFTRGGAFQLNNQGQITTQGGLPVLNDGGQAFNIPDTATDINISPDGFVTAKTDNGTSLSELGKVSMVKFKDQQALKAEGAGLYSSTETPATDTDSNIIQGALEQSNVKPISEMTEMMKIFRSYEQTNNMITQENLRRSDAITKLAKTTV